MVVLVVAVLLFHLGRNVPWTSASVAHKWEGGGLTPLGFRFCSCSNKAKFSILLQSRFKKHGVFNKSMGPQWGCECGLGSRRWFYCWILGRPGCPSTELEQRTGRTGGSLALPGEVNLKTRLDMLLRVTFSLGVNSRQSPSLAGRLVPFLKASMAGGAYRRLFWV